MIKKSISDFLTSQNCRFWCVKIMVLMVDLISKSYSSTEFGIYTIVVGFHSQKSLKIFNYIPRKNHRKIWTVVSVKTILQISTRISLIHRRFTSFVLYEFWNSPVQGDSWIFSSWILHTFFVSFALLIVLLSCTKHIFQVSMSSTIFQSAKCSHVPHTVLC